MFPYPIATPQGCNIQTFYGTAASAGANRNARPWNKPVGVSHVYMMLIGGGGAGNGSTGGGSGAVTVWYGAAQHVPNSLLINIATGIDSGSTFIQYRGSSLVTLISASSTTSTTGAASSTAGPFAASGFYKSTAGQNGDSVTQTPSSTTFLSAGATLDGSFANYGYKNQGSALDSFFQLQPIIVGVGACGGYTGSYGCGGGSGGGAGGPGMVLIASW